jgi:CheY-like chemotaxis protein
LLVEVLSEWQMKPTAVDGGVSALRVLTEYESSGKSFRLILLDAQMPGMDGFTLAALVKQESRLAGITVMMLTSVGFLGDAARCREIGIAAYLTKPIRRMELLEAIRVTLGGASSSHEPVTLVTRHTLHQGHARLRILLVEDNAVNQMLAVRLLEKRGHAVTAVGNGKDALKELSSEIFDVVLMDVQMPVMDGFEATAAIRSGEQKTGAHVPIIAMTAHALRDDEQRCLTAGMDAYISKPINSMELYELVESAARKRTNAAAEPLKK